MQSKAKQNKKCHLEYLETAEALTQMSLRLHHPHIHIKNRIFQFNAFNQLWEKLSERRNFKGGEKKNQLSLIEITWKEWKTKLFFFLLSLFLKSVEWDMLISYDQFTHHCLLFFFKENIDMNHWITINLLQEGFSFSEFRLPIWMSSLQASDQVLLFYIS